MYNNYNMPPYFSGYHQPAPNILPQQQVIQVNGKASVDTIQLAPNSSILVMDTSAPMVWLCVSDGVGKVTATAYDISVHKDAPPVDTGALKSRLDALEASVQKLMEGRYVQPDVKRTDAPDGSAG